MSTKHEEKALQSILRGETPEKRVMVGYQSDKKVESRDGKTIESPLTKVMQEATGCKFKSEHTEPMTDDTQDVYAEI